LLSERTQRDLAAPHETAVVVEGGKGAAVDIKGKAALEDPQRRVFLVSSSFSSHFDSQRDEKEVGQSTLPLRLARLVNSISSPSASIIKLNRIFEERNFPLGSSNLPTFARPWNARYVLRANIWAVSALLLAKNALQAARLTMMIQFGFIRLSSCSFTALHYWPRADGRGFLRTIDFRSLKDCSVVARRGIFRQCRW
jgi:hypothetical protein